LTLDDPKQSANTMNADFRESLGVIVDRLEAEKDDITGVVITSAKKTFFAGGDLNDLIQAKPEHAVEFTKSSGLMKGQMRRSEELVPAPKAWMKANPAGGVQPWDVKGYKIPGGTPSNPGFAANLPAFPANLRKQLKGANMPAPRAILAAAIEGAQVDFDTAIQIETRYFIHLATGQVSKNMTKAFFFDLQTINSGGSRPDGFEKYSA